MSMTIEELCSNNADYLESLTNKELYEILSPYLIVTRPDKVDREANKKLGSKSKLVNDSTLTPEKRNKLLEMAKQLGLDLTEDI